MNIKDFPYLARDDELEFRAEAELSDDFELLEIFKKFVGGLARTKSDSEGFSFYHHDVELRTGFRSDILAALLGNDDLPFRSNLRNAVYFYSEFFAHVLIS